jgi:hypothetical protein
MEQAVVESSVRRGRLSSPLKGMKVAPKYRGPGGETWSGRGARPRWLAAVLRGGKNKLDDFLIDKPARKKQKKRKKTAARKRQPKRQRRVARKKQPKRKTRISRRKQQKRKTVQKKQQNRKTIVQSEMVTAAINPAAEASE